MSTPQAAIFAEGAGHHLVMEYEVADAQAFRRVLPALDGARRDAAPAETCAVVAFGAALWRTLAPEAAPADFQDFAGLPGAPASPRDLLLWVQGPEIADVMDRALALAGALDGAATSALEERGFVYHDSRDLTGFIDGTANPKADARLEAALIPEGETGAGGSFVLTQRWVHDLEAFNALSIAEQERVIGRTKADSIELEGEAMPADSHVSRTDIAGTKIYRRSVPFGTPGEHGLYFLAFGRDQRRFDILLASMFGTSGDGVTDRLIAYSTPVTGAYWYAPPEEALAAVCG